MARDITLFGYTITKKSEESDQEKILRSFAPPHNDDGAAEATMDATVSGGLVTHQFNIAGATHTQNELINTYRSIATLSDVDLAIQDIVSEAIVFDEFDYPVSLNMENAEIPARLKKKIQEEFEGLLDLLMFKTKGSDIFRVWYIDGRLYYHMMIDEKKPNDGIQEVRYIDPRKIRKFRSLKPNIRKDQIFAMPEREVYDEYYIYSESFYNNVGEPNRSTQNVGTQQNMQSNNSQWGGAANAVRIAPDAIASANSGIIDSRSGTILSYLHKAIRPANHLKTIEDATVINRLVRAPERRLYYVDVNDLPKGRAEQYMNQFVDRFRNKLTYDSETGTIRDHKRIMSMIEDIFIPRRNGQQGTTVDTLAGSQMSGQMDELEFFQKKLYRALGVPESRLVPETGFSIGRASETSREELKYSRMIDKLRSRFSMLFDDLLYTQLTLKGILTPEEWDEVSGDIHYDFKRDNHFTELKESEILRERLTTMQAAEPYIGTYFTKEWAAKNILQMTEEQIKEMEAMPSLEDGDEDEGGAPRPNIPAAPERKDVTITHKKSGQNTQQQPQSQETSVEKTTSRQTTTAQESHDAFDQLLDAMLKETETRSSRLHDDLI